MPGDPVEAGGARCLQAVAFGDHRRRSRPRMVRQCRTAEQEVGRQLPARIEAAAGSERGEPDAPAGPLAERRPPPRRVLEFEQRPVDRPVPRRIAGLDYRYGRLPVRAPGARLF